VDLLLKNRITARSSGRMIFDEFVFVIHHKPFLSWFWNMQSLRQWRDEQTKIQWDIRSIFSIEQTSRIERSMRCDSMSLSGKRPVTCVQSAKSLAVCWKNEDDWVVIWGKFRTIELFLWETEQISSRESYISKAESASSRSFYSKWRSIRFFCLPWDLLQSSECLRHMNPFIWSDQTRFQKEVFDEFCSFPEN